MRKLTYIYLVLLSGLVVWSCEQDFSSVEPDPNFTPPLISGPLSAGSADFTKFISVGNSLTAGFQAAALFDDGQANSVPAILSQQFAQVGGGEFVQPNINSVNGYNSTFSDPGSGLFLGRLVLAGSPPAPTPTAGDPSSLPSPLNPAFLYSGDPINNFAVPGILLGQALIPETGDWSLLGTDPRVNPFYARFASNPGASTIIGDAVAAQGTFFMFWLGSNDVLGYATTGGSGAIPLTDPAVFSNIYGAAISGMTTDPNIQGVVGNVPPVTSIPFFKLVAWNAIPFAEGDPTIGVVNSSYALYNGGLALAVQGGAITQEEADLRSISFAAGANGIVIDDESLTDLSGLGLPSIRQANAGDLITLSAGSILGTEAQQGNPLSIIGVAVPLADQYVLIPTELEEINNAIVGYNTAIPDLIAALGLSDRIAIADVNQALANLTNQGAALVDGLVVTTSLVPPAGLISEDGVHPNSRGYAFTANVFIDAINAKFGANVPKANVASFAATAAPLP